MFLKYFIMHPIDKVCNFFNYSPKVPGPPSIGPCIVVDISTFCFSTLKRRIRRWQKRTASATIVNQLLQQLMFGQTFSQISEQDEKTTTDVGVLQFFFRSKIMFFLWKFRTEKSRFFSAMFRIRGLIVLATAWCLAESLPAFDPDYSDYKQERIS